MPPSAGAEDDTGRNEDGLMRGRKGSGNDLQAFVGTNISLGRDAIPGEQAEGQEFEHRACFSWEVTVV